MRLLVTGGAGFIGSNYVRMVLGTTDDHVTVLDALTYAGNLASLSDVAGDARFRFVHADITDREAVLHAVDGHDAIVHFAAESHVDRSIVSPDEFVHTNCDGTNVMCDVARRVGVERFVHVSTDEVYGSIESGSWTVEHILEPNSPYSASKASSDLLARSYFRTHGLPVCVTRCSNNYGPYHFPEKVIPLFVTNLLDGHKVPLYGDGLNVRDWLHVDDHCRGIQAVLEKGQAGEAYNLSGRCELSNLELVGRLLDATERDASLVRHVPDPRGGAHDRRYSADDSRARALGWAPRVPFDEGLAATVEWFRANRAWWEPLRARVDTLSF